MSDMYAVSGDVLTSIADAIREAAGVSTSITVDEMPAKISSISVSTGGGSALFTTTKSYTKYPDFIADAQEVVGSNRFIAVSTDTPPASGLWPFCVIAIDGSCAVYRRTSAGVYGFTVPNESVNASIKDNAHFSVISINLIN